jgi:hypothetical protein
VLIFCKGEDTVFPVVTAVERYERCELDLLKGSGWRSGAFLLGTGPILLGIGSVASISKTSSESGHFFQINASVFGQVANIIVTSDALRITKRKCSRY